MKRTMILIALSLMICSLSLGCRPTNKDLTIINQFDSTISVFYEWKDTAPDNLGNIQSGQQQKYIFLINSYDRNAFGCQYQLAGADEDAHHLWADDANGNVIFSAVFTYNQLKVMQFTVKVAP